MLAPTVPLVALAARQLTANEFCLILMRSGSVFTHQPQALVTKRNNRPIWIIDEKQDQGSVEVKLTSPILLRSSSNRGTIQAADSTFFFFCATYK